MTLKLIIMNFCWTFIFLLMAEIGFKLLHENRTLTFFFHSQPFILFTDAERKTEEKDWVIRLKNKIYVFFFTFKKR